MTRRMSAVWPDTTGTEPPADHLYACALWLLGRHRQLAELAERLPCVVEAEAEVDSDAAADGPGGGVWLDLDLLAEAVAAFDDHAAAWQDYRARTREPRGEATWDRWHAAGPAWPDTPPGHAGRELAHMSRTERVRLRLVAAFAPDGARLAVGMLTSFDHAGQALINDWLEAIRHA